MAATVLEELNQTMESSDKRRKAYNIHNKIEESCQRSISLIKFVHKIGFSKSNVIR